MSWSDLMLQLQTERYLAATRDPKKQPKPTSFGWPWEKKQDKPEVTPEERREYEKRLRQRSAFQHLRG